MDGKNRYIIAITGPSGAGKTTLGDNLSSKNHIAIPYHCTTRSKRNDDKDGFYKYLSHDEYRFLLEQEKFLISSGDGPIVSREYGNFYGVLTNDCIDAWKKSDTIMLFVSYKDIYRLLELMELGMNIQIINLTFTNIENGVRDRLEHCLERNHTERDIFNRVNNAILDNEKYGQILRLNAKANIFTDNLDIDQTYQEVCKVLKLHK